MDVCHEPPDVSLPYDTPSTPVASPRKRRELPDTAAVNLFASWCTLIPTLIEGYATYTSSSVGKPLVHCPDSLKMCTSGCALKSTRLICLYFDLRHGLFPTAPNQPRFAVSTELLLFYRALFERSCDAVNALASAMNAFYVKRGFRMKDKSGNPILEPFRKPLGQAVQWFDVLQSELDNRIKDRLQTSRNLTHDILYPSQPLVPRADNATAPSRDRAAEVLRQRCPACFSGSSWGLDTEKGGDVHCATDGNFHHRHRRTAGDSPHFHVPLYVLPKLYVDSVGSNIDQVRKRPAKTYQPTVLHEALDQCASSYEAADGRKQKAAMDTFDDTGLMALICRHDIPLFVANIDTPGEQQKYAIALIQYLFSLLPSSATVVVLYDVGCVLWRTLLQYPILPESIVRRLRFTTSAMHAYGHQWSCQLVYNPRMCIGLGLTDGEGVERLWSRLRKLIALERSSGRHCRIWLIDRQLLAIGIDLVSELGEWIRRRYQRGVLRQSADAMAVINKCGVPYDILEREWKQQKAAQLSIRAHAPARLKRELDTVLTIQAELESSDQAIQAARALIEKSPEVSIAAEDVISSMERGHDKLIKKVDALYTSLNVSGKFPELADVDLEFVTTLILARDLKINIRKRAVGSFFEWEKLDRAVGGNEQILGTKLHQHTRKSIAKRQPALMAAIRKYNSYCETLESLYQSSWKIPLPRPLPTKLAQLREDDALMEDVWISRSAEEIPRWLEDVDVRDGIRAMLKLKRCEEEKVRLRRESENLCVWLAEELTTASIAMTQAAESPYYIFLEQHNESLQSAQSRWASDYVTADSIQQAVGSAIDKVAHLSRDLSAARSTTRNLCLDDAFEEGEPQVESSDDHLPNINTEDDDNAAILSDVLGELGMDHPEDPETHTQNATEYDKVQIQWQGLVRMPDLTQPLAHSSIQIPAHNGMRRQIFDVEALEILESPTALLDDVCINGCATLLYHACHTPNSHQIAIFSTHDLVRIREECPDDILWRQTRWMSYWQKDVWIIPIHRPEGGGHWVLCIAHLSSRKYHLFDSLAGRAGWRKDVEVVSEMIYRLLTLAKVHQDDTIQVDISGYRAYNIVQQPCQTNGYDCGLWILATMAATLRGHIRTDLTEAKIGDFRRYLHYLVHAFPEE
ncbi:hypothetical protein CONPUDRAFT_50174 [Coniophora puteana RWD-64-598 SS2]|uniref:Ubiquitin-like protease family profile domain-containing protein n=1 Tax=Coniophora puteana (strain RWD-64-598) TaxID=741705 RepID=A0A5M3MYY6_CONPW|nr:uncharacterized protein CONPUDRAFT_50174 [Coniophora puteana RWD-64-598 SS2]EIW84350.1 hypothetical protein CONPUDRAFT_50174 [Coniophora puteana RWD-64-598 SS2]